MSAREILWVRGDSIGDGVLAASMLGPLAGAFPGVRITVICQEHVAPLYERCPLIHRVIAYRRGRIMQDAPYRDELMAAIRGLKADLCLNSVYSRELVSDFIAVNSAATERIAHAGDLSNIAPAAREAADRGYTRLLASAPGWRPELSRHRDFLAALGITAATLEPRLWTAAEDEAFADDLLGRHGLGGARTIALFAGAQYRVRIYRHYGDALARLCRERGFRLMALGSAEDASINGDNLAHAGGGVDLSGRTTLRQSAALLRRCRLAIGAETGLAHIACAVGTANVVLLGGGHFGRFMPYSPLTSAVSLPLDCFGCNWTCRYPEPYCVSALPSAALEAALDATLAAPSARPRLFTPRGLPWADDPAKPRWQLRDDLFDAGAIDVIALEKSH